MAGIAAADVPRGRRLPAAALRLLGDDRLFRLAAGGEPRAFEAIYERHHQALYRYCRSIVGNPDDAADALQNAMASALRGLAGESRDIPLKPWLFRIAHNECISLLRKRRAQVTIDDALGLEAPAHDPAVRQRLLELVADMRQLPDAQRGALVMHELSGLRYRDIATALDVTEPHARQLVYEARTALHDLAEGRAMDCELVRRAISDSDARVLRGRRIRSHLRACAGCSGFDELNRTRRLDLAAVAPPLPAALAAGLLHKVLGGSSGGASATAASGASGGGLGTAVAGKAAATSVFAKAAAVVAVSAAAGTGVVEVATHSGTAARPSQRATDGHALREATPATHGTAAGGGRATRSGPIGSERQSAAARDHTARSSHTKRAHPAHPKKRTAASHRPKPAHPVHPAKPAPAPKPQSTAAPKPSPSPKPKAAPAPAKIVEPTHQQRGAVLGQKKSAARSHG